MNELFVSYKREDERRVGRLVQALERTGLSIWWDRGLPGAENWRQQIQSALDTAKCVIVVWTHESVGPSGDFVRDEAGQAKRRGILVPVRLDTVSPPLGFGEIQAIDLTRWKGNLGDPFFQDLCAAVTAKLEGRTVPPARGPMKRLARRLALSSLLSLVGVGLVVTFNVFSAQEQICGVPVLQPHISDLCGAFGLGHRPTKEERFAWEHRERGSCDALRRHVARFPEGAYRDQAAGMLTARRLTQTEIWTPSTRPLSLFVGQDDVPARNEAVARSATLARAQTSAERLCRNFAAGTLFRFKSAKPDHLNWQCGPISGGIACGCEGDAVCDLEERHFQETETCGS
jgi:hypothetical protein